MGTKPHGSISDNNIKQLDKLLYVDDAMSLADLEHNLQLSLHNVNRTAKTYNMEISEGQKKTFF